MIISVFQTTRSLHRRLPSSCRPRSIPLFVSALKLGDGKLSIVSSGSAKKYSRADFRDRDRELKGYASQRRPHDGAHNERSKGGSYGSFEMSPQQTSSRDYSPGNVPRRMAGGSGGHNKRRRRGRSGTRATEELDPVANEFVKEIGLLGEQGRWHKALQTYRKASDDPSIRMTTLMYNVAIGALSKRGRWAEALSVMEDMQSAGCSPDSYTFNSAIQACANGDEPERAFTLFEKMKAAGIAPDVFSYNHLLTACKGGQWERALNLVEEMEKIGLKAGAITLNAVIVACGSGGQPDRAVDILEDMKAQGISRTEGTYCAVISACGKAGQWERALEFMRKMEDDNLVPNEYCYNAAVAGERRGQLGPPQHKQGTLRNQSGP